MSQDDYGNIFILFFVILELENLKQDEVKIEADGKCGFYCGGDGCISSSWKCDGDCDCRNCSDEMNCYAKGDRRKGEKTK